LLWLTVSSRLAFLLLRWKTADTVRCYPCWMCLAWAGYEKNFFKAWEHFCCRRLPKIQHSAAEHWGAHRKQDKCYRVASLQEQGTLHRPSGDPLHNCRQANDSQLFTSWVSPEQEPRPFHVCPWAVKMVTGRPASRTIRDWVVVPRHCRIRDH